ncbi:MAG: protein kinase domain-containing protein [Pseudonocardiaceae bacterium]
MVGWSVPGVVHLREVREDPVGRRVVARHRITRRPLAVTYLSEELLADAEFRARFAHEFGRLARIRDTRVLPVHRYVECHLGAAVVGDHVAGTALRALLLAHGAVGTEAALVLLKDSLRGLSACHVAGLAHGDIKPESVILTRTGGVRLVDFGLSTPHSRRLLARSTPFYLAPEQWSGRCATPAGDVYAATVMFFECLIGAPPFYADGSPELSAKHAQCAPPIDVIPEPVRELVLTGLAKNPYRRPEAASLLAQVDDVAARALGTGWEQRGRRELARLLDSRSTLPEVSALVRRQGSGGRESRRPVRLAAVVGGALVLAAGLSSPPLAVILPEGSLFGSDGRSPVLAFPDPAQGTSSVRTVTNGQLADSVPRAVPAAKAEPAGQSLAVPVQSNTQLPPAQSIPRANRQVGPAEYPAQGGHPAGSVESAQPRSAPASSGAPPAPEPMELPVSIELPAPIKLPAPIPASIPVPEQTQPRANIAADLHSSWDQRRARIQEAFRHAKAHPQEQPEPMVDADVQPLTEDSNR